jgi:hypothetical protein
MRSPSRPSRHPTSPSPEVAAAIERELRRRPTISLGVLQHFASGIDPSIAEMDPRRFHAEYVVRVEHRLSQERASRRPPTKTARQQPHSRPAAADDERSPTEEVAESSVVQKNVQASDTSSGAATQSGVPGERQRKTSGRRSRGSDPAPAEVPTPEVPLTPREPSRAVVREKPRPETEIEKRKLRHGTAGPQENGVDRVAIRAVFLEFALEVAAAESRVEIVQVLSRIDRYVEQVARHLE